MTEQINKLFEEPQKVDEKSTKIIKKTTEALAMVTKSQTNLNFESWDSTLDTEEQDKINEELEGNQIKSRVYFIRHGKSVEDKWKWNTQSNGAELRYDAEEDFKKIWEFLKEKWLNANNTYIIFHDGGDEDPMIRIIKSAEIIAKALDIPKKRLLERVFWFDSTRKEIKKPAARCLETAYYTSFGVLSLIEELKDKENINLVCVIHKSNIWSIRQTLFPEENKWIDIWHLWYANGEIQEVDVKKNWLVMDYSKERIILPINSCNCDSGLLEILKQEEELRSYIARFKRKEIQIWELQNLVNVYFMKNTKNNTKLFEKHILSENRDLRVFCIVNLLVEWNIDIVDENIQEFLEMEKATEIIDFINTILSVCTEEERKKLLEIIVKKRGVLLGIKLGKLEYYANYEKYVKENIEYIRNKSLDERLKAGEDMIIPLWFQWEKYETMDELLESDWITLIEWEAGAGKSTKLLEIMEYLKPSDEWKSKYFPVYINLWSMNYDRLKGEIERQTDKVYGEWKYKFVYLFDALDESKYDDETKKKLMEYIDELDGKVIITSRQNNLPIKNNQIKVVGDKKIEVEIVKLKDLDKEQIEEYISTYLSEEQQQIWKKWKEKKFIKWIESNPLMLSIICNLLVSGENIDDIDTIVELYERIIDSRLVDWEETKNSDVFEDELEDRKVLLWELAYNSFLKNKQITEEFILDMVMAEYNRSITRTKVNGKIKYNLECLNMIFRKNKEGEYSFIHESFREYFAAKLIAENLKNNTIEYWEFFQIIKNSDLNFLDMLSDLLDNDLKFKLSKLIIEYKQYFQTPIDDKIIYLLGNIDNNSVIWYLSYIQIWKSEIKILWKIWWEDIIEFLKTIVETNWTISVEAIEILGEIWWEENIKYMKKIIESDERLYLVRTEAIEILGEIWWEENIKYIREIINANRDKPILKSVIRTLWEIWWEENIKYIREIIPNLQNIEILVISIKILIKVWGKENRKFIRKFMKFNRDSFIIDEIIRIIWGLWWEENIELIKKIIEDLLSDSKEKSPFAKVAIFNWMNILKEIWWEENIKFIREIIETYEKSMLANWLEPLLKTFLEDDINLQRNNSKSEKFYPRDSKVMDNLWQKWWEKNVDTVKERTDPHKELRVILEEIKSLKKIWWEKNINLIDDIIETTSERILTDIVMVLWQNWLEENIDIIKRISQIRTEFKVIIETIKTLWMIWWKENIEFIKWFKNNKNSWVRVLLIKILWKIWWKENIEFIEWFGDNYTYKSEREKIERKLWRKYMQ